jgi:hypothetical protein
MPAEIHKNGAENEPFPSLFDLKIAKKAFFHSKEIKKIYSQDVFDDYSNFRIFRYLRYCGVIPV